MSSSECTKERFLEDVKNHKIEIIRNDGLYRHIRLSKGSSTCQYDILTWPGHLCITGDCGSYLFARIEDMFEFFRNDRAIISPDYWAEKCLSESRFGEGLRKFSVDMFNRRVIEYAISDCEGKKERKKILSAIDELLHCEDEWECVSAMRDFDSEIVSFVDFWEDDCKVYTFHFIWCLYAIVFAIQKYDESLKAELVEVKR